MVKMNVCGGDGNFETGEVLKFMFSMPFLKTKLPYPPTPHYKISLTEVSTSMKRGHITELMEIIFMLIPR